MSTQIQYSLKVSRRARHVRLMINQSDGLVVVIPIGFDERRVPGIIAEKADWIHRTQQKINRQVRPATPELARALPDRIQVHSTGETWRIEYVQSKAVGITLTQPGDHSLRLTGAITNRALCQAAFRRWTNRYAKSTLPPTLVQMARDLGFSIMDISIRNQRTRWGSCSRQKAISLNQKLIFLPPDLVRYVMLHELCHTMVLSHSKKFWDLVGRYDPAFKKKIKALRGSAKYLPIWA